MEKIKEKLTEIQEIQDQREEKYHSWLKTILTLAIGLLGIIISLKSDKSKNIYEHIFFVISIIGLAVGILSGSIVLYSEITILEKLRKNKEEYLLKMLDGNAGFEMGMVKRHRIYNVLEIICFCAFIISLIALIAFSISTGY